MQRLTKAVQIGVADPEVRQLFTVSLVFENADLPCKEILGSLKLKSTPMVK